jgi:hypothetical protein
MALSVRRACSAGVGGIDPWTDSGGGCAWIGGYAVPSADAALSLLPSSPSAKLLARPFSTAATSASRCARSRVCLTLSNSIRGWCDGTGVPHPPSDTGDMAGHCACAPPGRAAGVLRMLADAVPDGGTIIRAPLAR